MKKLRRILFGLMLSCQVAMGLIPVFRMHFENPPIYKQEEIPLEDIRKTN